MSPKLFILFYVIVILHLISTLFHTRTLNLFSIYNFLYALHMIICMKKGKDWGVWNILEQSFTMLVSQVASSNATQLHAEKNASLQPRRFLVNHARKCYKYHWSLTSSHPIRKIRLKFPKDSNFRSVSWRVAKLVLWSEALTRWSGLRNYTWQRPVTESFRN